MPSVQNKVPPSLNAEAAKMDLGEKGSCELSEGNEDRQEPEIRRNEKR